MISEEAEKMIEWMIERLNYQYCYKGLVVGLYDLAIRYYKKIEPPEGKDFIIEEVLRRLRNA